MPFKGIVVDELPDNSSIIRFNDECLCKGVVRQEHADTFVKKELAEARAAAWKQLTPKRGFTRRISVNRGRTVREMLDATGRRQNCDSTVFASMPRGEGPYAAVTFFELECDADDDEAEKQYRRRGLKAADPYSLAAINEQDPAFADTYPNATHWRMPGEPRELHPRHVEAWGTMTFYVYTDGSRRVNVQQYAADKFLKGTWLAGIVEKS